MSYRATEQIADYGAARISLLVEAPFSTLRARLEEAAPAFDPGELEPVRRGSLPWADFLRALAWQAPHGFVRVAEDEPGRVLALAGGEAEAVLYLLTDWAIAARVHRLEPTALLYVPIRLLLASRGTGATLSVEHPGPRLAAFGVNKLAQAGAELDRRLGDLLEELDLPRPSVLRR